MRTTITLDADLAAKLKAAARERGTSFKAVVNDAIRSGFESDRRAARPYKMQTRSLGVRPDVNLDRASRLAADLEDAEIVRKLDLRK